MQRKGLMALVLLIRSLAAQQDGLIQQIVLGTVVSLSGDNLLAEERQAAADTLAGYELWVDAANRGGGIQVGGVDMEAVLKVYDDAGDPTQRDVMYQKLADSNTHFLLGGGKRSVGSMQNATRARPLLSMVSRSDYTHWNAQQHPYTFSVLPAQLLESHRSFVGTMRTLWGLERMAMVVIVQLDAEPYAERCQALLAEIPTFGVDVVFETRVQEGDTDGLVAAVAAANEAAADFLVACGNGWEGATAIMRAAKDVMISGVNVHDQDKQCFQYNGNLCRAHGTVLPQNVELHIGSTVKFIYVTDGIVEEGFERAMDGWASRVSGAALPFAFQEYSDPLLGSTSRVKGQWWQRVTWGNGREMTEHGATAVASGIALQLAIEGADSLETGAVAAAMRSLDVETFFGRVRVGPDGRNSGLQPVVVQWDCTPLDRCVPRLRIPAEAEPIQPYRMPCHRDYIWSDSNQLSIVFMPDESSPGQLPPLYSSSRCIPCQMANFRLYQDMLTDFDNVAYLQRYCPQTFLPIKFATAATAGPVGGVVNSEILEGLETGLAWIRTHEVLGLLFAEVLQLQTLPLQLQWLDAEGRQVERVDPQSKMNEFSVNVTAGQQAMKEVEAFIDNNGYGGYILWNERMASEVALGWEDSACAGGGLQLKWFELEICATPAVRLQGSGIAQIVQHFAFSRYHLVVGPGLAAAQMVAEFERKAAELGLALATRVDLPPMEETAGRESALERVAGLDDCRGTVVVLLADRSCAEQVFSRVLDASGWVDGRRMVVIGSESATRAWNAPVGMLGLRTVAEAESLEAQTARKHRGSELNLEGGVESGWMDVAAEDIAFFVHDAVALVSEATLHNVFFMHGFSTEANEAAVLSLDARIPPFLGATGRLAFEPTQREGGRRMLERVSGRLALLNRAAGGWEGIATMQVSEGRVNTLERSTHVTLSQEAWETEAVEWGVGAHSAGGKPGDTCECVVWRKMGPHSDLRSCALSPEAVAVLGAGGLLLLLAAAAVWRRRRQRVEEAETVLRQRTAALRVRLRLRRADGFALSSDYQGINLLRRPTTVIPRGQLEALARMTLFEDFDPRAVDSLAWSLRHGAGTAKVGRTVSSQDVEAEVPEAEEGIEHEEQYQELRAIFLETSSSLLDPGTDRSIGRPGDPPPSNPMDSFTRRLRYQSDGASWNLLRAASPSRRSMPASAEAMARQESFRTFTTATTQSSDGPHRASPGSPLGGNSPMVRRLLPRNSSQRSSSAKGRFKFFAEQVAQVHIWQDDDQSLFRELKEQHVQHYMDQLRGACDSLYKVIQEEESGRELVGFVPGTRQPHGSAPAQELGTTAPCADAEIRESPRVVGSLAFCPSPQRNLNADTPAPAQALGPQDAPSSVLRQEAAEGKGGLRGAPPSSMSIGERLLMDVCPQPAAAARPTEWAVDSVLRQDDARVRAVRMHDDDWREAQLEASAHVTRASPTIGDEEVYLSQLHRRAVLLDEHFQRRVCEAMERKFGSRMSVCSAPVKTKGRMREKVWTYSASTDPAVDATPPLAANILDPVRASVVCDGPSEVLEVASFLLSEGTHEGLSVVRVKNKFALTDASEYDGYRDLMICVLFDGPNELNIIGEVQIHDRRLHSMKLLMHKLYRVKRATSSTAV